MQTLNLEGESHAIPFERIKDVLDYLPYGNEIRVIFQFLLVSGARISEIEAFRMSQLYPQGQDFFLYFKPGKNQKGFRKEKIPGILVKELQCCREQTRCYQDQMFSISPNTFRRYFNRDVRPKLPKPWQERTFHQREGQLQEEYKLQLKGLRKDFQTLLFAQQLEKWKDSGVALEFTSKRMKHSSARITAYHYIVNFDELNISKYLHSTPEELLRIGSQKRILDFMD